MRVAATSANVVQTKVVHISDTHLGNRQDGGDGRCDATAFEQAIGVAVERDADAVVHTGDLFDDPRPALSTITHCADVLDPPGGRDVPFYAIVGNHDRGADERWLDLFVRTNAVTRLGPEPRVVGDAALYGIDAVRPGDWQTTDFSLEDPPAGVDCTILCMHELLEPPGNEVTADYPVEDVLDRVTIDLDGLALGGFHQPKSAQVDGTDIWYAGATKRFETDEAEAGVVQLLEIEHGNVTRQQLELEARSFVPPPIATRMASVTGGTGVDDDPGQVGCSVEERAEGMLQTAQNAVETAALHRFRQRSRRETVPAVRDPTEAGPGESRTQTDGIGRAEKLPDNMTDKREVLPENMIDERKELVRERNRLEAELSELGAAIDDIQAEIDAIDDDLAEAVTERDAATEAFLPDERLQESVSNETRDAIESYLDALAEKRDVRSEKVAMRDEALDVETKNAANAREDIEETAAVVDRLAERTDESESTVEDAREELDDARSTFEDDLAAVAAKFGSLDFDLSAGTLGDAHDVIPERYAGLQASVESASDRVGELSTRKARLAEDRDKLRSIEGGGTCPTCSQEVGPVRTEREVEATEEELDEVELQLGAAKQERDELIARREELADLRDEVIALRALRSETMPEMAGRVEDRQEDFEDLQADLEEERAELAESKEERDEADAAIATLETEIDDLEAEIDRLHANAEAGEASLEAFDVVDELRARREERIDELADLQEEHGEMEANRELVDAEITDVTDGE